MKSSIQHCLRRQVRGLVTASAAASRSACPVPFVREASCPSSSSSPASRRLVHSHCVPKRQFVNSARLAAQSDSDATSPKKDDDSPGDGTATATASTASSNSNSGPKNTKRKARPKATKDSLRRVAMVAQDPERPSSKTPPAVAPSIPADSDPNPTVSAVCLAEGFEMATVLDILRSHSFEIDPDGTGFDASEVVHARGFNNDDIFVFPSGTVVTWGVDPEPIVRTLLSAAVETYPESQRETEDLEYHTDPLKQASTLRNDVIILGTQRESMAGDRLDTTLAKIAFSSGVARSAKLGVLETALTTYLETTRPIPDMLSKGASRFHLSPDFIWQKAGELLSLRARLNHYSELTDSLPDIFWDRKTELNLENYYDDVGRALDVRIRIHTLNQKMDYAGEIGSILRQMFSEQHGARSVVTSHRLEIIIIVLIAVELLLALRRETMEGNLLGTDPEEETDGGKKRGKA